MICSRAEYAAQAIPGAEGLGVTVIQPSDGNVQIQASEVTAAFVREIDILQYEVFSEGALHHEHSDSASGRKRVFWARIVVGLVSAP
jgi:hypothetical protein